MPAMLLGGAGRQDNHLLHFDSLVHLLPCQTIVTVLILYVHQLYLLIELILTDVVCDVGILWWDYPLCGDCNENGNRELHELTLIPIPNSNVSLAKREKTVG